MTLVGVLGMLLSLLGFAWMTSLKDNRRLGLWAVMVIAHLVTTFVYYLYVQTNDADTKLYYFDLYDFADMDFSLGTLAVVKATQGLKAVLGGTYLDFFLLYQVLGIWGIAFVYRMLEDLTQVVGQPLAPGHYALLMLPGMYFWTSAIGKDAPMFFACAMAVWTSFAITRRWPWLVVALVVMILIRPHIALLTLGAVGLALVAGKGISNSMRFVLLGAVGAGGIVLFSQVRSQIEAVTGGSNSSLGNFVEVASIASGDDGIGSLASQPLPLKLLSLMYRPFFVDADSVFGLVASLQNIGMIAMTIVLIRNFKLWREMFRASFLIRFVTIHAGAIYLLLALMYYNVGLGLRQREMATPAMLVLAIAAMLVGQRRRQLAQIARQQQGLPAWAA